MGPVEQIMHTKLTEAFAPETLEISNDSHRHAGHAGKPEGNETHFKVTIVSKTFEGKSRIQRHRMVFAILKEEMDNPIHALALKLEVPNS